tara:strand:+ start:413 stop:652 length:240 start_codon:yes stop_codon:yes gene_type:complete
VSGDKKITYTFDNVVYDVSKFSDDGKFYFQSILELNQEIGTLNKKAEVLKAASLTFNTRIKDHLEDEMKAESPEEETTG